VVLQFEPGYELATIKAKAFRPPADWSKRGEMGRIIMGILREAAEPLSTRDITCNSSRCGRSTRATKPSSGL